MAAWLGGDPPEVLPDPLAVGGNLGRIARSLAAARVIDPALPEPAERAPLRGEVSLEERRLRLPPAQRSSSALYDGYRFQALLREALGARLRSLDPITVVFTDRKLLTWDEGDRRQHLRAIVLGVPGVVSLPGLIEGPARPREYYRARERLRALGMSGEIIQARLEREIAGRFLTPRDPRLVGVAAGYALQAYAYLAWGEASCPDPRCRLFNAHWQEEILRAQGESGVSLCPTHLRALNPPAPRGGRRRLNRRA